MATLKPRTGTRLSVEEFMELPDTFDKRKMELDEGELYIMPRLRTGHQALQGDLIWYFQGYLRTFDDPPAEVLHDVIVALSLERRILYSPDLAVILRGSRAVVTDRTVEGPPDIVVEILSSDHRRDLVRKRQVYAEAASQDTGFSTGGKASPPCWNCVMASTWNGQCWTPTPP